MSIGQFHMSAAMELFANAHERPFGTKAKGQVEVYLRALEPDHVTPEELIEATDRLLRTHDGFPRIPHIRAMVATIRTEAKAAAGWRPGDGVEDRCPGCKTLFRYAGYEMPDGSVLPRWRCNCYPAGPGWHTTAARAWVETDTHYLNARTT